MNNIYDEISTRVTAFMQSHNNLLLLKTHVGSGKTSNTLMTLNDDGHTWIYLAPFHTVIHENLEMSQFRKYDYYHLQSRAKLCLIEDWRRIAEKGIDIRPICEHNCPLKDTTCPYYEIKRNLYEEPKNWAGVHHHIPEFLPDFFSLWSDKLPMHTYYDVVVIDENPINVLFENETANANDLDKLKKVINKLNLTHRDLKKILDLIDYLIVEFSTDDDLDYSQLLKLFKYIDYQGFYDEYQERIVEAVRDEHIDIKDLPKEYIKLFRRMDVYMNNTTAPYMFMKRRESQYTRKNYYLLLFDNVGLVECPIKIIGLDGTANVDIWQSITERTASIFERRYKYNNIFQLKGKGRARYPLSSWIRNKKITSTGKNLCFMINEIVKKKKYKALIACTKPLQRYIYNELKNYGILDKIQFCNYYYIRSRNDFYENCDTVMLSCEPNVQEFQIECFSFLSKWDKKIWRQVFTQEEMVQTVGRIREPIIISPTGRIREPREVYIFPYTPVTNNKEDKNRPLFEEATILNYNNLLHYIKTGKTLEEESLTLKDDAINLIKNYPYTSTTDIANELKISRLKAKNLMDDLQRNGGVDYDKGWYIYRRD